jgi:Zn-dependent peptidase ImmA (M78 family)
MTLDIERKAESLLTECGALRAPVPLDTVIHHLALTAQARQLAETSGVLVVENGRGMIGYNVNHSRVRQRFTIAHEIGHFVMHASDNQQQRLFVDRSTMFRRNENSSTGDDHQEVEANRFAAALLMPEKLIREEIASSRFDLDDEEDVGNMAKHFNVSAAAMTFRLKNLNLFQG